MNKPVEYHYLEVPIGSGKLCIYASKDLDLEEFKIVEKYFRVWSKFFKRRLLPKRLPSMEGLSQDK